MATGKAAAQELERIAADPTLGPGEALVQWSAVMAKWMTELTLDFSKSFHSPAHSTPLWRYLPAMVASGKREMIGCGRLVFVFLGAACDKNLIAC